MRSNIVGIGLLAAGLVLAGPAEARRVRKAPATERRTSEPGEGGGRTAVAQAEPSAGDPALQEAYPRVQALAVTQARLVQDVLSQTILLMQGFADGNPSEGARALLRWADKGQDSVRVVAWQSGDGIVPRALEVLTTGKPWVGSHRVAGQARILVLVPMVERHRLVRAELAADRILAPFASARIGEEGRMVLLDAGGAPLSSVAGRPLAFGPDALLPAMAQPQGTFESSRAIYGLARIQPSDWAVMVEAPKAALRAGGELPDENRLRAAWPVDPPITLEAEGEAFPWRFAIGGGLLLALGFGGWRMLGTWRRRRPEESMVLDGDWGDVPMDPEAAPPLAAVATDGLAEAHREARREQPEEDHVLRQAVQQQGRDHERMLGQLQQSLELTIEETRRQFHDILEVHQGRMKALAAALETTRADLAGKAEGEVMTATLEELRTRMYEAEADQRQQGAGLEKRLSAVQKRLGEMDQTLGRAVDDLKDKLSDDLLGRQEALARDMEMLEGKTRDTLRQMAQDGAQAKLHGAQAAERAAELEGQFQQLRAKVLSEVEDVRRQAMSDLSSLRQQMHQVDLAREELKDTTVRFEATRAEWEQSGALLHQRMADELAAFQDRLFEREGQVEKLRILVEEAVSRSERLSSEAEWKRERTDKDLDLLKGKVFLAAEGLDKLGGRFEECLDDVTALHARMEQLQQETYRGREDLKEFRTQAQQEMAAILAEQRESQGRLLQLVQSLVKQYQTSRDVDDRVTQALEEQERRMASINQDLLAIRHVVQARPGVGASNGPVPGGAPGAPRLLP
ncbi:MAG: hypothetical protein VKO64_01635 [Candidatus Sericytochromatia bacterium]|nr:hypothetical protein [Candidatus Sericytochromatia bacterium]